MNKAEYKQDWKEIEFASVVDLYNSVGWIAYTNKPGELQRAFENSSYINLAFVDLKLVGVIRTLSDSVSIHYIQDIIVHPDYQRHGVGGGLLDSALSFYKEVRTHVLLTDNEGKQKLFYESLGFKNPKDLVKDELNSFIKMKGIELS
jgi:ribosomal protein S18 acetylase RimI-like enzyme